MLNLSSIFITICPVILGFPGGFPSPDCPLLPQSFCYSLFPWFFSTCRRDLPLFQTLAIRLYYYFRSQSVHDKGEHGVCMEKKLLGPHFSSTVSSLPHKPQKYLHSDIPCQSAHRTYAHTLLNAFCPIQLSPFGWIFFFFFSAWWLATLRPDLWLIYPNISPVLRKMLEVPLSKNLLSDK